MKLYPKISRSIRRANKNGRGKRERLARETSTFKTIWSWILIRNIFWMIRLNCQRTNREKEAQAWTNSHRYMMGTSLPTNKPMKNIQRGAWRRQCCYSISWTRLPSNVLRKRKKGKCLCNSILLRTSKLNSLILSFGNSVRWKGVFYWTSASW